MTENTHGSKEKCFVWGWVFGYLLEVEREWFQSLFFLVWQIPKYPQGNNGNPYTRMMRGSSRVKMWSFSFDKPSKYPRKDPPTTAEK